MRPAAVNGWYLLGVVTLLARTKTLEARAKIPVGFEGRIAISFMGGKFHATRSPLFPGPASIAIGKHSRSRSEGKRRRYGSSRSPGSSHEGIYLGFGGRGWDCCRQSSLYDCEVVGACLATQGR